MSEKDTTSIRQRIAGRTLAMEILELADLKKESISFLDAFCIEIASRCPPLSPPPPTPSRPTMTNEEAKRFENIIIQFGVHRGYKYLDCPIEYLIWLSNEGEKLASYLRSDKGQRRQGEVTTSSLEKERQGDE